MGKKYIRVIADTKENNEKLKNFNGDWDNLVTFLESLATEKVEIKQSTFPGVSRPAVELTQVNNCKDFILAIA